MGFPDVVELLEAEVLVGLATDTTVYLSRRGGTLKVDKLTFAIRASDSCWHPGLPGRPLFPRVQVAFQDGGRVLPPQLYGTHILSIEAHDM